MVWEGYCSHYPQANLAKYGIVWGIYINYKEFYINRDRAHADRDLSSANRPNRLATENEHCKVNGLDFVLRKFELII